MKNKFEISIITVVLNDADGLVKTIESVINQTHDNIEYIIIDGGSTNETIKIINKYKDNITHWVSEPDKGIYDAMNKGIKMSSGTWLNFMNAGDTFVNSSVLKAIDLNLYSDYALIYGNIFLDNKVIQYPSDINKALKAGNMIACHQAMFFNKDILKRELKYSTQYKILGDYDLIVRISLIYMEIFKYININIAIYQGGGVSFELRNFFKIAMEKKKIQLNHFGNYSKKRYLKTLLGYVLSYFPKFIQNNVRVLERIVSDFVHKLG